MMPRLLALALLAGLPVASAGDGPTAELPRSSPEAQGIPSSALLAFVDAAEAKIDARHSLMVVRHGYVVAEGWLSGLPMTVWCWTASTTSRWATRPRGARSSSAPSGSRALRWRPPAACPRANRSARRARAG